MFDLGHLTPSGTAKLALRQVHIPRTNPSPVVLELRHAGETNPRYKNALLKAPKLDGEARDAHARQLLATHVIVGWANVCNEDGPIAYTAERGTELLDKLSEAKRTDLINQIVAFAQNADNFVEAMSDAGDLGNE